LYILINALSNLSAKKKIIYLARSWSKDGETVNYEKVEGMDKGPVILYALSTCIWCEKTKKLLVKSGVGFRYAYVDLLKGDEREVAIEEIKRVNPSLSFPTLVVGDKAVVGFKEKEIKEAVGQ
jgi:glutaredoxin-like protein NrdH